MPGMRLTCTTVVNQTEALTLKVLKVERPASVPLHDVAVRNTLFHEAPLPPAQAILASDAQPCARDAARAAPLGCHWPVEEGQVSARCRPPVRIEQVVGAGVVLVHRLLDQAHAERARVEGVVAWRIGGDGREMMDPGELHV